MLSNEMSGNSFLSADQNGLTSNVNLLRIIFDVLFFPWVIYNKASILTGGARIMPEETFSCVSMKKEGELKFHLSLLKLF